MNEVDVLKIALSELDKAKKLKQMNIELWNLLMGSIYYIFKYSEKNNISLPQRNNIFEMIKRCETKFNDINNFSDRDYSPTESQHFNLPTENQQFSLNTENEQRNKTPDEKTEPNFLIFLSMLLEILNFN